LQLQEGEEKGDADKEEEEEEEGRQRNGRREDINYADLDKSALSEGIFYTGFATNF
jgi:hypothetical protein